MVGATEAAAADLAKFRDRSGATYPILHGLSADSKTAYGVTSYPSVRLLAKDGTIAATDEAGIKKILEGS